jgi:hypothetical protein
MLWAIQQRTAAWKSVSGKTTLRSGHDQQIPLDRSDQVPQVGCWVLRDRLRDDEWPTVARPVIGHRATEALQWDDQYAAKDWDYQRYGRPDVIFMRYDSDVRDREEIRSRIGKHRSYVKPRVRPEYEGRYVPERGGSAEMGTDYDIYTWKRMGRGPSRAAGRAVGVSQELLRKTTRKSSSPASSVSWGPRGVERFAMTQNIGGKPKKSWSDPNKKLKIINAYISKKDKFIKDCMKEFEREHALGTNSTANVRVGERLKFDSIVDSLT